jgi:hypothetical protein
MPPDDDEGPEPRFPDPGRNETRRRPPERPRPLERHLQSYAIWNLSVIAVVVLLALLAFLLLGILDLLGIIDIFRGYLPIFAVLVLLVLLGIIIHILRRRGNY